MNLDVIAFSVARSEFPTGADYEIVPVINGRSLLDIPAPARRTKAGPRSRPGASLALREAHAGLAVFEGSRPDLSTLEPTDHPHDAAVLGCVCGVTECGPVLATIRADGDTVSWSVAGREFHFARAACDGPRDGG